MRFEKAWIIARKDMEELKKIKYVLYTLIGVPIIFSVVIPITMFVPLSLADPSELPADMLDLIVGYFLPLFILLPAIIPSVIASYSFVGEKLNKSMEPLLATPTTDTEFLFGKCLAAFIPTMLATYAAFTMFVAISDYLTLQIFNEILLPNVEWLVGMLVVAPLVCVMGIEADVLISSKVNDVRAAQQVGGFVVLPLIAILILSMANIIVIGVFFLLVISALILAIDLVLWFIAKGTFQREEILTKWK